MISLLCVVGVVIIYVVVNGLSVLSVKNNVEVTVGGYNGGGYIESVKMNEEFNQHLENLDLSMEEKFAIGLSGFGGVFQYDKSETLSNGIFKYY